MWFFSYFHASSIIARDITKVLKHLNITSDILSKDDLTLIMNHIISHRDIRWYFNPVHIDANIWCVANLLTHETDNYEISILDLIIKCYKHNLTVNVWHDRDFSEKDIVRIKKYL